MTPINHTQGRPARPVRPITSLSDDTLQSNFLAAFQKTCRLNRIPISNCEVEITRGAARSVVATVRIQGFAGDVTERQFYNRRTGEVIRGGEQVKLAVGGYNETVFRFAKCENASGSEFLVTYKPEVTQVAQ